MRLIFMGTPEFAVPSLDAVCGAGHTVALVITQPDKPKGRKLTLTPPPVKERALLLGLRVYQPESMRSDEAFENIKAAEADCCIVAAYGKILPQMILEATKYGCVNVHSSLLPKYRGAAPINWAVLNGEATTGVTIMQLDSGVDTGDILLQRETPVEPNETAGELHDRLAVMGAALLLETLERLPKGQITPIKQDSALASKAPMLDKSLSIIDFSKTAKAVHDKIRGLLPWPVAETLIGGKRVRVHSSLVAQGEGRCGEVLALKPLTVACKNGAVILEKLQGDGGRVMSAEDYLRGRPLDIGTIIGE